VLFRSFTSIEDILPELKIETFHYVQKPELKILLDQAQKLLFQP